MTQMLNTGQLLHSARVSSGLGLRQAARLAGTSHATLSAYERDEKTPSVSTFIRILEACSYSVDVVLHPRIRQHNGLKRGDELVEVLSLAEQFPAKPSKRLTFPRFQKQ